MAQQRANELVLQEAICFDLSKFPHECHTKQICAPNFVLTRFFSTIFCAPNWRPLRKEAAASIERISTTAGTLDIHFFENQVTHSSQGPEVRKRFLEEVSQHLPEAKFEGNGRVVSKPIFWLDSRYHNGTANIIHFLMQ